MPVHFQFPDNAPDCSELVGHFKQLNTDVFGLFGLEKMDNKAEIETKEYNEGGGWMNFACKDYIYTYKYLDNQYIIQHETMYNGHLGELEQNISIRLNIKENNAHIRVNCLCSPYHLSLSWEVLDEPILEKLELLLIEKFGLLVVNQEDTNEEDGSEDYNPNNHSLYK